MGWFGLGRFRLGLWWFTQRKSTCDLGHKVGGLRGVAGALVVCGCVVESKTAISYI